MRILLFILLALTPGLLQANGKKPKMSVSFHIEVDASSGKKLAFRHNVAGRERFFSNSAALTHADFIAYESFPSEDGNFGMVFLLKQRPAKRFLSLLLQARGRFMVAQVNGRFVDIVRIDQPKADRKVVIWRGVTAAEVRQAGELLPRISELGKKKD